ncbi:hypothetical protein HD600_000014 [Microbacterium ginsengiterrae]|uniref:Uncharacterized protein n=1 Tax=Microbacterium ginsengiterrae TaxID=546115 RepID=A0A7W9C9I8_9MICO|nr:hypothetical protein [Microbacterium ginsengiterrae]MBB5741517.1 hypothetical protein [Microbacterium ginsengiterrae]
MSAVAYDSTFAVPRGATTVERWSIRLAKVLTRWATERAERRHERRDAMLAAIHAEQAHPTPPLATDHLLAQAGLRRR